MSYIYDNLMEDEEILYEGRLSLWSLAKWMIAGALLLPFIFVDATWGSFVFALGVVMMTAGLVQFATTEMAVTTQRVISKRGWIARGTTEISLARVEGVEVNQTMAQRLLNYGHILVSGVGSHKARINNIASPMDFRKAFLSAVARFEESAEEEKESAASGGSTKPHGSVPAAHQTNALAAAGSAVAAEPEVMVEHSDASSDAASERRMREELGTLVARIEDQWVVVDHDGLMKFIERWRKVEPKVSGLLVLNEESPLLEEVVRA